MPAYYFTSLDAVKTAMHNKMKILEREKTSFLSRIFPWLKQRKQQRINALDYLLQNLNPNSTLNDFYYQKSYIQMHHPATFSRFSSMRGLFRDMENFLVQEANKSGVPLKTEDANFSELKQLLSNRQSLTVSEFDDYCKTYFPTIKTFINDDKFTAESAIAFAKKPHSTQELQVFLIALFAHLLSQFPQRLPLGITTNWLNFSSEFVNNCPNKTALADYPFILMGAINEDCLLSACVREGALGFDSEEDSLWYRLRTDNAFLATLPHLIFHVHISARNPGSINVITKNTSTNFTRHRLDAEDPIFAGLFRRLKFERLLNHDGILLMNTSTPDMVINAQTYREEVEKGLSYITPQALDEHAKPLRALFAEHNQRLPTAIFRAYCQKNYPELMEKLAQTLREHPLRLQDLTNEFRLDPPQLHILIMLLLCYYSNSDTVYHSWVGASNVMLTHKGYSVSLFTERLLDLQMVATRLPRYLDQQIIHFISDEDATQQVQNNNGCIAYISPQNPALVSFSYCKEGVPTVERFNPIRLKELDTFAVLPQAITAIKSKLPNIANVAKTIHMLEEIYHTRSIEKIPEVKKALYLLPTGALLLLRTTIQAIEKLYETGKRLEEIYATRTVIGFSDNTYHLTFHRQNLNKEKNYLWMRDIVEQEKQWLAMVAGIFLQGAAQAKAEEAARKKTPKADKEEPTLARLQILPLELMVYILDFLRPRHITQRNIFKLFDKTNEIVESKSRIGASTPFTSLSVQDKI